VISLCEVVGQKMEVSVMSKWIEMLRKLWKKIVSVLEKEPPLEIEVDVSEMDEGPLLKMFETEWQDHFQTRRQTWQALEIAALLTVAIVGIQWKASHWLVGIISSMILIGVSLFGMQITFRHRNSVEIMKFTIITEIEKRLKFKALGLGVPKRITLGDILRFWKSNTSLFLLRMQAIILILGIVMLVFSIVHAVK